MQNIAFIYLYWLHVGVTILVGNTLSLTCFRLLQNYTIQVTAPSVSNYNSIVEWNTKLGPHIDTHCPFPKDLSSLLETYLPLWNLIPCSRNLSASLSLSLLPYYRLPPQSFPSHASCSILKKQSVCDLNRQLFNEEWRTKNEEWRIH